MVGKKGSFQHFQNGKTRFSYGPLPPEAFYLTQIDANRCNNQPNKNKPNKHTSIDIGKNWADLFCWSNWFTH